MLVSVRIWENSRKGAVINVNGRMEVEVSHRLSKAAKVELDAGRHGGSSIIILNHGGG